MSVESVHTADLDPRELEAARAMVFDAFGGRFDQIDWRHSLGGIHVISRDAAGVIDGHSAIVARSFRHGSRQLRCGYVEGVAVRSDRRRRGIGDALMERTNAIVTHGYEIGGLGATNEGARLYARHDWTEWRGRLAAFGPAGAESVSGGWVWVFDPHSLLDVTEPLTCDWRDGDRW